MHVALSYFQAIIMGILQGVTELFPISSLGHGVLVPAWFGWHNLVSGQSAAESFFLAFLVGLHVGTAVGLLMYYRRTWMRLLGGLGRQISSGGVRSLVRLNVPATDPQYRVLALLAVGTVPVGIVGLAFEHKLRTLFAKPLAAAIFLTINGLVMFLGEWLIRNQSKRRRSEDLATLPTTGALAIGGAQILALFAGISRAGVTMVAGLLRGLDHSEAAELSFLLATPVILLAGLYKIPDLMGHLGDGVRVQTLVGALCSMVAAWFAVKFLTRWFSTRTLTPFAVYSLLLGIASIIRFA